MLDVRVPSVPATLRNLMPASLARSWTEGISEKLSSLMSPQLGTVLADGGRPVSGLARELAGDQWAELAREMLLPDETGL